MSSTDRFGNEVTSRRIPKYLSPIITHLITHIENGYVVYTSVCRVDEHGSGPIERALYSKSGVAPLPPISSVAPQITEELLEEVESNLNGKNKKASLPEGEEKELPGQDLSPYSHLKLSTVIELDPKTKSIEQFTLNTVAAIPISIDLEGVTEIAAIPNEDETVAEKEAVDPPHRSETLAQGIAALSENEIVQLPEQSHHLEDLKVALPDESTREMPFGTVPLLIEKTTILPTEPDPQEKAGELQIAITEVAAILETLTTNRVVDIAAIPTSEDEAVAEDLHLNATPTQLTYHTSDRPVIPNPNPVEEVEVQAQVNAIDQSVTTSPGIPAALPPSPPLPLTSAETNSQVLLEFAKALFRAWRAIATMQVGEGSPPWGEPVLIDDIYDNHFRSSILGTSFLSQIFQLVGAPQLNLPGEAQLLLIDSTEANQEQSYSIGQRQCYAIAFTIETRMTETVTAYAPLHQQVSIASEPPPSTLLSYTDDELMEEEDDDDLPTRKPSLIAGVARIFGLKTPPNK